MHRTQTGNGQTVALLQFDGFFAGDIAAFTRSCSSCRTLESKRNCFKRLERHHQDQQ